MSVLHYVFMNHVRWEEVLRFSSLWSINSASHLLSLQAVGDRQQVPALNERLQEKQRLLPGVQLLRLLQPLPPGGGLVDPLGTDRQWVGGGAQEEGEAA